MPPVTRRRGAAADHTFSLLLMPMVKFCSPGEPRFLSTLEAIESALVATRSSTATTPPTTAPRGRSVTSDSSARRTRRSGAGPGEKRSPSVNVTGVKQNWAASS
jgi:hypothetical protein